jgi:3-methyladenine DNA glycosylase/8-oxoguanine DNA glycosylase
VCCLGYGKLARIVKAPRAGKTSQKLASPSQSAAEAHLFACDDRMGKLMSKVGPLGLTPGKAKSTFDSLTQSIVYQQLSGKAAATIHGRVCGLFEDGKVEPEGLIALGDDALRGAGLSRSKLLALRDLAERTLAGTVPTLEQLRTMSDDAIVESLVQVRGIGRWSAEMLLIFRLGRPDVLPVTDYGIRHGFMLTYGKRSLPTPEEIARYGERWRPHRTAASWYLWRAVDLAKAQAAKTPRSGTSSK